MVPFPPGGSSDVVTRLMAQKFADNLKANVVIQNSGGGGGVPAAIAFKQAAADGYTLFLANNGLFAIMPAMTADIRFDPIKDFQPVTPLFAFPSVLVVPSGSPARNAKELVALAKSKPTGLNLRSQGVGSGGHILGEMFRLHSGAPLVHVPYRGADPRWSISRPATSICCSAPTCRRSARCRAASSGCWAGPRPSARRRCPTCPTMAEAGYPGTELEVWQGIVAPLGTPPAIVKKLNEEFIKAAHAPEIVRKVAEQAVEMYTTTPERNGQADRLRLRPARQGRARRWDQAAMTAMRDRGRTSGSRHSRKDVDTARRSRSAAPRCWRSPVLSARLSRRPTAIRLGPITLLVPFPPGGSADTVIRPIAQKVADALKQPIVIDNRPGGGGNVAAVATKQAAPDGYTLFLTNMGVMSVNPILTPDLRFDPMKDFQPITPIISFPHILVVPADSPAKTIGELAAWAKTKPGGLSFGSQGVGSGGQIIGEMFKSRVGAPMVHVPFRGAAPAATEIMAGRIDFLFTSYISIGEQAKAGKLRMIAVAGKKRTDAAPDLPTVAEAGFRRPRHGHVARHGGAGRHAGGDRAAAQPGVHQGGARAGHRAHRGAAGHRPAAHHARRISAR